MKKIFRTTYLALLLISGLSCNNDPMPDAPKGKYPILFRCSDETRAVATVESMKADTDGFDVYAYIEASTGAKVNFEKNVWWDKDQLMWLYDDIEYWVVGAKYWFKAVYPKGIATVDNDDSNQAVTISGYDITSQKDILVATTGALVVDENGAPNGGPTVVSLNFQHLLANVTIKVLSELATPVEVERIELRNIASKGDYNGSWNIANYSSRTFGIDSDITLNKAESETDYTDITNGGIIVVPEQINGTQKLYIKTTFKEYEISFPTTHRWDSGKKYTYTLTIKQEYIEFNEPKVDIWDEENATGSVVIK
jgi:hypothetical protein